VQRALHAHVQHLEFELDSSALRAEVKRVCATLLVGTDATVVRTNCTQLIESTMTLKASTMTLKSLACARKDR
jgi:hypothetical protein